MTIKDWLNMAALTGDLQNSIASTKERMPTFSMIDLEHEVNAIIDSDINDHPLGTTMASCSYEFCYRILLLHAILDGMCDYDLANYTLKFIAGFLPKSRLSSKLGNDAWSAFVFNNLYWRFMHQNLLGETYKEIYTRVYETSTYIYYLARVGNGGLDNLYTSDGMKFSNKIDELCQILPETKVVRGEYAGLYKCFVPGMEKDVRTSVTQEEVGYMLRHGNDQNIGFTLSDLMEFEDNTVNWENYVVDIGEVLTVDMLGFNSIECLGCAASPGGATTTDSPVICNGKRDDFDLAPERYNGIAFNYADLVLINKDHEVVYKYTNYYTLPMHQIIDLVLEKLREYPDTIALVPKMYYNQIEFWNVDRDFIVEYARRREGIDEESLADEYHRRSADSLFTDDEEDDEDDDWYFEEED